MGIDNVDNGNPFDWGKSSHDYGAYRDIYPASFYESLLFFGVGKQGQSMLDLGTGTGIIPRHLSKIYSCIIETVKADDGSIESVNKFQVDSLPASFVGVDSSKEQIEIARSLSKGLGNIEYKVCHAEDTGLPGSSFDIVTACQCFWYFDKEKLAQELRRVLKPGGRFVIMYMNWLPYEDRIAKATENLVLKHNPNWTGGGFSGFDFAVGNWSREYFVPVTIHTYKEAIPFTKVSWRGRVRACRGVGPGMTPDQVAVFDKEHQKLLDEIVEGDDFTVLHQIQFEIYVRS